MDYWIFGAGYCFGYVFFSVFGVIRYNSNAVL